MADLLLELQVSEMPADAQAQGITLLEQALKKRFQDFPWREQESYTTPRRLTLILKGIPDRIPERMESRRGPKVHAEMKAIQGFAKSMGVELTDLEIRGEYYHAQRIIPQSNLQETLEKNITLALKEIKWPKSMHWNQGNFHWIRPLRRILCILEKENTCETLQVKIQEIPCGNLTQGHFLMHRREIKIASIQEYEPKLRKAHVILSAQERRQSILDQIHEQKQDLEILQNENLLDEIVGITEYPVVFLLDLEQEFRDLPDEILEITASQHQRFIPLLEKESRKIQKFAVVANLAEARNSQQIQRGYARVLRSRLLDAKMLWEQDMKNGIENLNHDDLYLGNIPLRIAIQQIAGIAQDIAQATGENPRLFHAAGMLSKIDIQTRSVQDFREQLRGITASYMARNAGNSEEICQILREQYWPEQGDTMPEGHVSLIVANKMHLLWGFFDLEGKPKGSNDRHGLRAKALAITKLILEKKLRISLNLLIRITEQEYEAQDPKEDTSQNLLDYMVEKALNYMQQEKEIPYSILQACIPIKEEIQLFTILERAKAIDSLLSTPRTREPLLKFLEAVHRIQKILETEDPDNEEHRAKMGWHPPQCLRYTLPDYDLPEEKNLAEAYLHIRNVIYDSTPQEQLLLLVNTQEYIHRFFEHVHIQDPDPILRNNRLLLLRELEFLFRQYAQFGEIQVPGVATQGKPHPKE